VRKFCWEKLNRTEYWQKRVNREDRSDIRTYLECFKLSFGMRLASKQFRRESDEEILIEAAMTFGLRQTLGIFSTHLLTIAFSIYFL